MKAILLCITALILSSCASQQPRGFILPPALSETFRNGQLKGLEAADSAELGLLNPNDMISRTCTSAPLFDLYGNYIRTDVRCR